MFSLGKSEKVGLGKNLQVSVFEHNLGKSPKADEFFKRALDELLNDTWFYQVL